MKKTILLVSIFLAACAPNTYNKEQSGTLIGAGLGAIVGSQLGGGEGKMITGFAGAALGSYLGNQIGQSLDKADALYYQKSLKNSLEYNPSGVASTWRNPDSGHHGRIIPRSTYSEGGYNCREFLQEVFIGGRKERAFGKACRRDDGSWEIISR